MANRKKICLCTTWGVDGENFEFNGCPLHSGLEKQTTTQDCETEYQRGRQEGLEEAVEIARTFHKQGNWRQDPCKDIAEAIKAKMEEIS
jgi:flagellar biosynthesis/type III secretory pathway protein FliH